MFAYFRQLVLLHYVIPGSIRRRKSTLLAEPNQAQMSIMLFYEELRPDQCRSSIPGLYCSNIREVERSVRVEFTASRIKCAGSKLRRKINTSPHSRRTINNSRKTVFPHRDEP